jgi:hypothetical protein
MGINSLQSNTWQVKMAHDGHRALRTALQPLCGDKPLCGDTHLGTVTNWFIYRITWRCHSISINWLHCASQLVMLSTCQLQRKLPLTPLRKIMTRFEGLSAERWLTILKGHVSASLGPHRLTTKAHFSYGSSSIISDALASSCIAGPLFYFWLLIAFKMQHSLMSYLPVIQQHKFIYRTSLSFYYSYTCSWYLIVRSSHYSLM